MKKMISLLIAILMAVTVCSAEGTGVWFGDTVDNVYRNESLAIGITLDEDWLALPRDQMMDISGMGDDMLDRTTGTLLPRAYEEGATVMDLYAMNTVTSAALTVTMALLSDQVAAELTELLYVALSTDTLSESLEDGGMEDVSVEVSEWTMEDGTHPLLLVSGIRGEYRVYERMLVIQQDNVMLMITAVTYDTDDTAVLLERLFRIGE